MTDWPTIDISTPYGSLVARIFAGPTSVPGTIYASDHVHPSAGHAFGRDPDPASVTARVYTPDVYMGRASGPSATVTINAVAYTVDGSFTLGPDGWAEDRASFGGPLTRLGAFVTEYASTTTAARKAWREVIVPMVIDALDGASNETASAISAARHEFRASVTERVAALRAEADRLAKLTEE